MKWDVDEAVRVAQIDLRPVHLRAQIQLDSLCDDLHLTVARLNTRPVPVVVDRNVKQGRKVFQKQVTNRHSKHLLMPRFEGIRIFRHNFAFRVERKSFEGFIQGYERVMVIAQDSDCVSFQIADMFEQVFIVQLPERFVVIPQ